MANLREREREREERERRVFGERMGCFGRFRCRVLNVSCPLKGDADIRFFFGFGIITVIVMQFSSLIISW